MPYHHATVDPIVAGRVLVYDLILSLMISRQSLTDLRLHETTSSSAKCSQQGLLESAASDTTTAMLAGRSSDKWDCLSVTPPVTMSSSFKQPGPGPSASKACVYSKAGNPSRNTLEACFAALEGAKHCFTFASGMGAITTAILLLKKGQHIVVMNDVDGATRSLFSKSNKMDIEVTFTDLSVPGNLEKSIKSNTKMVFFETPTNPVLKVIDIAAVAKAAKSRGDIIVVVDNTFLTPYLQKPLKFGADIVLYSITKYLTGLTDVVMGAILVNDDIIADKLKHLQCVAGIVPSPFDCYMVNRSLKTLPLRMERHKESALLVAGWLDMHPKIVEVLHPGLPTHPNHDLGRRQMSGHSGVFSFRHCGGLKESKKFLYALKVFTLSVSLGGYESLAEIPWLMTHAFIPEKDRLALGITNSLVRISVGLEDVLDLLEDLDRALRIAFG
ncbi:putative cystathionine gamma-lyase 2 [Helicoverpa armigera]|uniref:putative cystathionine gamma-lyase 2 n=1 Tax=Helicoverpa armigera TaxID=29058 RepID=UPI00308339D7